MKTALCALFIVALISGICFADIAPPSYICPSGQTEDLQCAKACCEQAGGTYTTSDETCTTETYSQLQTAFQCEDHQGCCKGGSPGCCGSIIMVLAGLGLVGFASFRKLG